MTAFFWKAPWVLIALYEDRPWNLVGVKIAVLSLAQHCPGASVAVHAPNSDAVFASWLRRHSNAELITTPTRHQGWDVKPEILLGHLRGNDEVVWFDSDLLCVADWRDTVGAESLDTVVSTEDAPQGQNQGGRHRAVAWGLPATRSLPRTINTAFLRVTKAHIPLVETWGKLLVDQRYRRAQGQPILTRPQHLIGDQEVFTALMSAREFADTPFRLLRQGSEIAHCYGPAGYSPVDRLRMARAHRVPFLLHAMGQKPWEVAWTEADRGNSRLRTVYERAHVRWSPYSQAAVRFADGLEETARWMDAARRGNRGSLNLAELPLAVVDHVVRRSRARLGIARFPLEGAA